MKNPSSEEEMDEKLSEILHLQDMFFVGIFDNGGGVILMNYPDEEEF